MSAGYMRRCAGKHRCVRIVAGTGERIPVKRIHPERKEER